MSATKEFSLRIFGSDNVAIRGTTVDNPKN